LERLEKTLLVSTQACDEVERWLRRTGSAITKANDGNSAVERVRKERFDAALLVSTGNKMDLAETVFNLRDLSDSMAIIMVADHADVSGNLLVRIARTTPNTIMVNLEGLPHLLHLSNEGDKT
jgi:DNA-binding NtrC family response regulator